MAHSQRCRVPEVGGGKVRDLYQQMSHLASRLQGVAFALQSG